MLADLVSRSKRHICLTENKRRCKMDKCARISVGPHTVIHTLKTCEERQQISKLFRTFLHHINFFFRKQFNSANARFSLKTCRPDLLAGRKCFSFTPNSFTFSPTTNDGWEQIARFPPYGSCCKQSDLELFSLNPAYSQRTRKRKINITRFRTLRHFSINLLAFYH